MAPKDSVEWRQSRNAIIEPDRLMRVSYGRFKNRPTAALKVITKSELIDRLLGLDEEEVKDDGRWFIGSAITEWTQTEVDAWNEKKRQEVASKNRKIRKSNKDKPESEKEREKTFTPREDGGRYREASHVEELTLMAVDIDDDLEKTTFDELCSHIDRLGYEAVVFTTHSHGAPGKGNRYRVVFFLSEPWRQAHGRAALKEAYHGLYQLLGLGMAVDSSCSDPARLFYFHAAPEDRAHLAMSRYIPGQLLNWATLRPIPSNVNWVDLFEQKAPSFISEWKSAGLKHDVTCPNAAAHSDGGDSGAFVSLETGSPVFHCMHAHCEHLTGSELAALMINKGWITFDDLFQHVKPDINIGRPQFSAIIAEVSNVLIQSKRVGVLGGFVAQIASGIHCVNPA